MTGDCAGAFRVSLGPPEYDPDRPDLGPGPQRTMMGQYCVNTATANLTSTFVSFERTSRLMRLHCPVSCLALALCFAISLRMGVFVCVFDQLSANPAVWISVHPAVGGLIRLFQDRACLFGLPAIDPEALLLEQTGSLPAQLNASGYSWVYNIQVGNQSVHSTILGCCYFGVLLAVC